MNTHKTNLKAVTFDLWETLLFESDGANAKRSAARCRNVTNTLNKFGVKISLEQTTKAMNETINALLKIWDQNKDITHLDQLRRVVKFASDGETSLKKEWIPELSSAYISSFFETPPYLNPDAREALRWLRDRNMRIGIICNTGMTPGFGLRKFLKQEGVAEFFDLMIFSDEVGIRKPDPEVFNLAVRKLKTRPQEMVHIGDNMRTDVCGAKNAGFKAIHLTCEEGRDKQAEKDPTSLVSRSKDLGKIDTPPAPPDKTINSLAMVTKAIEEIETETG